MLIHDIGSLCHTFKALIAAFCNENKPESFHTCLSDKPRLTASSDFLLMVMYLLK